jgi:hypothetical protein
VYAICAGYEDLNDHDSLRHDRVLQLGAGREGVLASAATLCRTGNRADRAAAWAAHQVLVEQFLASHAAVLGLTATLQRRFQQRGIKQRACTEFRYAAKSWPRRRRVVARIECVKHVIANLSGGQTIDSSDPCAK